MDEIAYDSRFSHIIKDAKYKKLPRHRVKVKIDERFKSMFHDKKFQVKCEIDKRGREAKIDGPEDLQRYYKISDNEDEKGSDIKNRNQNKDIHKDVYNKIGKINEQKIAGEKNIPILTPEVKKKLKDLSIDYARGEGAIFSSSSSDEESTTDSEYMNEFEFDHRWGELDNDADHIEEATSRLAVCNLDWDRIGAVDLMVLFSSFLPSNGTIYSVTIYPSDFGCQRMKLEEEKGPIELVEVLPENQDEESEEIQMEKIRKYQLNRLKYYYAVVVCNSPQTADVLYKECDGLDYECSSSKLDLRFIPDDITFDQEPRDSCNALPDLSNYKPKFFVTSALTKAKVDLTWDETDINRQEIVKSIHNGDFNEQELKKYLACSSSEDETEFSNETNDKPLLLNEKVGYLEKYKALLADAESNEMKKKNQEVDMEVTWNLDLEKKANAVISDAAEDKKEKTPFQKYLEKRKEKKKIKSLRKKSESAEQEKSCDNTFSDDDIPSDIDLNDPYFTEELNKFNTKNVNSKKKLNKKLGDNTGENTLKNKKAELELLMLDSKEESKHFSLKNIQENEKAAEKKSKKGRKRKARDINIYEDEFNIDVNDERFSALYTSHHFNIDPADSQYKATKGIKKLIEEKLKRRERENFNLFFDNKLQEEEESKTYKKDSDVELSCLVKKIKRNTSQKMKNKM